MKKNNQTKKFSEAIKSWLNTIEEAKESGVPNDYHLCWYILGEEGRGFWIVLELFEEDLKHINPKKIEIIF